MKFVCDWELFELSVFQLVNNAIKFSDVGDKISVEAYIVRSDTNCTLKISVIDSGKGIRPLKL